MSNDFIKAIERGDYKFLRELLEEEQKKSCEIFSKKKLQDLCFDATNTGDCTALEIFIEYGLDVNMRWRGGQTLSFSAASYNQKEALALLIKNGAILKNEYYCENYGPCEIAIVLNFPEILYLLLENGAEPVKSSIEGVPDSHHLYQDAAIIGSVNCLRILFEFFPSDLNKFYKKTLCHDAVGHHEALEFLIKSGASCDLCDESGHTPLQWAVAQGFVESVRVLIDAGASVERWLQDGYFDQSQKLEHSVQTLRNGCYQFRHNNDDVIKEELKRGVAMRNRLHLTDVSIGLRAKDLPVLCVLEIASWLHDSEIGDEVVRWEVCKRVKHFQNEK